MQKRKIIFLTLDATISGGIERVVSNMVQYYSAKKEYDVKIISFFKQNERPHYYFPSNVEITFLSNKCYDLTSLLKKIVSHIAIIKSLFKLHLFSDAIILSTTTNISIYLALFFKKSCHHRLIAAEHGYYYAFGLGTRIIRRFAYQFVDVVVTLTKSEKEIYSKFCKRVITIPNALSFYPDQSANFENKRVISVGRLVKEKGFENLLPVYIELGREYPDWEFVIIGSGYLQMQLDKYLEQAPLNVKVSPPTSNIQEEMLKSSVYVCSSSTEAFPMVLLEAQACGLAVISFSCPPGPAEILTPNLDGILVEPDNFFQLKFEIIKMIYQFDLRQRYGINARKNVKRFLPLEVYSLWDSLFSTL